MSAVDALARALGASGLARLLPARGPLIVMYHGLGGPDGVDVAAFGAQLDLLAVRRRIVPLGEAVAALGRPEARGLAAITFDDGYRDFAEHALPALAARGLSATLFVPAGHLGGWNRWDEGVYARREILAAAELRALDPRHASIGAHGLSHRRVAGLGAGELRDETRGARTRLEDALGRAVLHFAYPYGQRDDFDGAAEQAVRDAGFDAACSTCFGRGSTPAERHRLRRVGVEPRDTLAVFARKLDGGYDFVAAKEALGAALRRRSAGAARASAAR